MLALPNKTFSARDWFGLMAGVSWGLVLGRFFSSGDMAGVWLVVILGPPVMLLISPSRPILGWQVPILAAAASSALMQHNPQDTVGTAFGDAILAWFMCSLFSWPWAVIFLHRAKRVKEQGPVKQVPVSYVGLVLLVFLACGLTVAGFALTLYPASSDADNGTLPFYGFLMATAGIVLSATSLQLARKLGVNKPVTDMLQLLLLLPSLFGVTFVLAFSYNLLKPKGPSLSSSHFEIWCALAGLEALAILIWVTQVHRREQRRLSGSVRPGVQ